MPKGVYEHRPNQGFQKGHGNLGIDYSKRKIPCLSEKTLARLRESGKNLGKYTRTEAHRQHHREVGSRTMAKLHGKCGTWIENRFQTFLEGFGLEEGVHYLAQSIVYTSRTHRRPDFLLANNVIIEVDGEPWHDPWKDYLRDLDLAESGYKVFRFTGKEINFNPVGCCDRLVGIVNRHTLGVKNA